MAKFAEQFVQQVAEATDIVDLVGQYVALKKGGKDFVGLCPFHEDHKPSMYVSPTKQIYKCFSCGAGGGPYQFLMGYEKLTFPEAVRHMAERAGIPIPIETQLAPAKGGLSKQDLGEVTTFAARFYRDQLFAPAGEATLAYARQRQLTDESIKRFGLGFAPDSWDALITAAHKAGISDSQLVAAGLAVRRQNDDGCYDRFRNRLMFPILETTGRVIAFGGRAMDSNDPAKYLNSSETALFDKSANLYALNWSRKGISKSGQAIVVEGYLDAIMALQHGLDNVVAALGTALTDRQARMLSRYASQIVLVFDPDAAGTAAAERAVELFLAQKLHVRVATMPEGLDPCDFCLAHGSEAMIELIKKAPDALAYMWQRRLDAYQQAGGNLADRGQLVEQFLQTLANSSAYGAIDPVKRGQLAQHIGHMLNISATDLEQIMRRLSRRRGPRAARPANTTQQNPSTNATSLTERHILEVLLNKEDLISQVVEKILPSDFTNGNLQQIAEVIWRLAENGKFTAERLMATEELAEMGALLTELVMSGQRRGNFEQTLNGALDHLEYRRKRRHLEYLKSNRHENPEALRKISEFHQDADKRRRPKIQ